jgi:hypothetical protein
MPPEDSHAPTDDGPTCAGLDIRLRHLVAVRDAKRAERDAAIAAAARLMREIDGFNAHISDLIETRLAVMMGDHAEPTVDLARRIAPFVGHA